MQNAAIIVSLRVGKKTDTNKTVNNFFNVNSILE